MPFSIQKWANPNSGLGPLSTGQTNSAVRRTSALTDIQTWADEVSRLADQIQQLRQDADRQIVAALNDANSQIRRIHELNSVIAREAHLGNDITTLKEQREDALTTLSKYVDVSTYDMGNGYLGVTAAAGIVLVDSGYRQIDYTAAGTVSTATVFEQIMVRKVDPDGDMIGTGTPLDPNRRSGTLDGLLAMRDEKLPDFALSLGELASQVVDRLNAVHNENVAAPPPETLTGRNTGLVSADTLGFTGVMTFAMIDASNDYTTRVVVDFDNMTLDNGGGAVALTGTSLNDFLTDMNGANGFNGAAFSFSNGVLEFTATGTAIGVATAQDATNPSDRGGRGFSHFFGLNDLLTASGASHHDTGFTATSLHALSAGGSTTLQLRGPHGEVAAEFDLTVANINVRGNDFQAVLDELNDTAALGSVMTFSLDADGHLVATPNAQYDDYRLTVIDDTTNRGSTGASLSQLFGLGPSYGMDAAHNVRIVDLVASDAAWFALGRLDESAAALAGTVPAVSAGDNQGAIALHNVANESIAFSAAGNLTATTGSFAEYSANVISDIANAGHIADQFSEDRQAFASAIAARITDISGVNMDEELAAMLIYQNAFAASARIITTVREMFDVLLEAAG